VSVLDNYGYHYKLYHCDILLNQSLKNNLCENIKFLTQKEKKIMKNRKKRKKERKTERKKVRKSRAKFEKFHQKKFQRHIRYLTRNCNFKENVS
jgi:hypothetical protein